MDSPRTILVATDEGLHLFTGEDAARAEDLAGRAVLALAAGDESWWALVDGRELWRSAEGSRWSPAATAPRQKATCLAATPAGLLVGTARAHLLRLERDRLVPIPSFDEAEGREAWYTPWGAPADVRSISAGAAGALYVNVHVGGVLRSTDGGAEWRPTLDIEHDVHQVLAPRARPGLVLVAAADGFGTSRDGGDTWRWQNDGLHAHYCRAVALAGDTVLLGASTGHRGRRAALYRRLLDGGERFERCQAGLPGWFADNVDTGCLAAEGGTVVAGTEDGCVFLSRDAGQRWDTIAKGLAPVRAVALSPAGARGRRRRRGSAPRIASRRAVSPARGSRRRRSRAAAARGAASDEHHARVGDRAHPGDRHPARHRRAGAGGAAAGRCHGPRLNATDQMPSDTMAT